MKAVMARKASLICKCPCVRWGSLIRRVRLAARLAKAGSHECWPVETKTIVHFAMGLIAAKPVKPCDGGVFGPLNLLLKKE